MTIIKVVCGIVWKEGKVLIARRKPNKSLGGYWEFPGGKLEPGEDYNDALSRELLEELDMKIKNRNYFGEHIYSYDSFTIHLIAISCDFLSSSFRMTDHDAWEFVWTENLSHFKMAEADWYFVDLLNK